MNPAVLWSAIIKIVESEWPAGTDPWDAVDTVFNPLTGEERDALILLKMQSKKGNDD